MKQSSSLTNFNSLMETTRSEVKITESMVISKANDSKQVTAGLAALSNRHETGSGILMKGSLITRPLGKDIVKNLLSSNRATRLEGFNSLMFDNNSTKSSQLNKSIYIGKVDCIRTLRKGGYF